MQDDPDKLAGCLSASSAAGVWQAKIHEARRQFLRTAYPVALAGPVLAKMISCWTGRLAGSLQSAFDGKLVKGNGDEVYRIENGLKTAYCGTSGV